MTRPGSGRAWIGTEPAGHAVEQPRRPANRRSRTRAVRDAIGTSSSGATKSATTATMRGRGARLDVARRVGPASAATSRPSPRTATAAIATMPPIEVPNSATRVTPRSPSQARAPATSSTSSRPNVVGPSSDSPCPRKSSARTPRRPAQERAVLDEVRRDWSRTSRGGATIASCGSATQSAVAVAVRVVGRAASGREPQAVARPEPDDLAAERIEGRRQRRLVGRRPRRVEQPIDRPRRRPTAGRPDARPPRPRAAARPSRRAGS